MASASFSLTNQTSDTVLVGDGEIGRVRFSSFPPRASARLVITRNGVTTTAPISSPLEHGDHEDNNRACFMDCGMPGDTLSVMHTGDGPLVGIVEGVPVP